jgi:hypothetical protein
MGKANGRRPIYAIYPLSVPGGDTGDDLAPALRVLHVHRERYGSRPIGLVVNRSQEGRAQEALNSLGVGTLQVTSNGGCLSWECWLAVESSVRKSVGAVKQLASLSLRNQAARDGIAFVQASPQGDRHASGR